MSARSKVEKWKAMVGWERFYEVSDRGRVKRIIGGRGATVGRILSSRRRATGYPQVRLHRDNVGIQADIHPLIAATFLGPCPAGHQVHHRNGDQSDNRVGNLQYVTRSENACCARDMFGVGLGEQNGQARLTTEDVRQIRHMAASSTLTQKKIGLLFGICKSQVGFIVNRKRWAHVA